MKATFVEVSGFTGALRDFMTDDAYAVLQQSLMENPDAGTVMPGCGGLRKIRTAHPKRGKGKRGGARVIYLHIPAARRFYLLDIYGKDEKDDLSSDERRLLSQLADELRLEATNPSRRQSHKENPR